eukprot:CAMPEP_0119145094 /NCGR_PEP_ID=MMETSP1310-20130426/37006_1 /TAXON_ID=464262 /ORGANISM="Genus nov. species nov., Strain RCC2339" /LENGTH=56 /DNA_ID=CAMNT_0007136887 /DNA_START=257 /DNA_END=424 /DNA_ORIENTATION=+
MNAPHQLSPRPAWKNNLPKSPTQEHASHHDQSGPNLNVPTSLSFIPHHLPSCSYVA